MLGLQECDISRSINHDYIDDSMIFESCKFYHIMT